MYPNTRHVTLACLLLCAAMAAVITGCSTQAKEMNPAFAKYIEAFTTGIISKQSAIRIQLAGDVNVTHTQNEPLEEEIFSFSPSIKGKAYWVDATTVEFRPDQNLTPGKTYKATFKLGKVMTVPSDLKNFEFEFQVIKPSFDVEMFGLRSANNSAEKMTYSGVVRTADLEEVQAIEKLITVKYDGAPTSIAWQHDVANRSYKFTISNIVRKSTAAKMEIAWNGKPINSDVADSKTIEIPAIGDFKVLDIKAMYDPEEYVVVQFSSPINMGQSLDGLIGIGGVSDLRYTVEGSEVKVFAPERLEGNYTVVVNEGILSVFDEKLNKGFTGSVNFENRLPSVTIPGKGVIMPQSGKLVMPFDAVGLKAVDVVVIRIYENNIPQYLQRNSLDGQDELRRVARPVAEKTIYLDQDKSLNLHKRNRFNLDLEQLVKAEPGAIYRVTIGFRKEYALYSCKGLTAKSEGDDEEESEEDYEYYGEQLDEDDSFWRRYDSYYPYGYKWSERDNPCHNSYYNKEKWASRNIISSNIGLIAKRGNDNSMVVAVTNIIDAKPLSGVELELLDYQQQVIFSTKSDGDGFAKFELKRKPYLLIAKRDNERGYLKLDDGSSLPLGRFDVKGEEVQQGMKGFLYGERGVWRPGDSIYLTFMLEDKEGKLPPNHPVILELYNPKGQLYKRINQHESLNGFYNFNTLTDPDAPTGSWQAKVKVGGAVFSRNVRIETVKPNRLKVKLDFGPKQALIKDESPKGTLSAAWLFGATAQSLKAKVDVSLTSSSTAFPKFDDYHFDDPTEKFSTENKTIFEGALNEDGVASVAANIPVGERAPGALKANFEIKVFEPGGDFSIDHFSMPYHVFDSYVGVSAPEGDRLTGMLVTDKPHQVNIVNVDANGTLISGTRQVEVELYKIRWRWWWDENSNEISNFTEDNYNQLLQKKTVTVVNGKGSWPFIIRYPDWGRYLIRVKDLESGHITGQSVYVDWPNYAERLQKENPAEAAMLVFTSNKTKYTVGEEVVLTIPSSEGGRGLISIESGSKVIKTDWVGTEKGQTVYKFKAEKEMAPNIYVNVSLLQPHAQTANDLPIRMYGTVPILVEDPNTILKPVINIPATLRPEADAAITVSEASGKAMTYTIAIVDEGLLDLTRFKTPDPHSVFYAREALGVKTWDLFDYVIGAWGADLERILSIGGDEGLNKGASAAKANRFKPVVKFMGPFALKKGDKQTHNFKLPPYIGSVKAMVVAGQEGAYGFADKAVAVKKPLMILATVPRVLGPGETIQLPVTVFGLEPHVKQANVTLASNAFFEVVGESTKQVSFPKPGEQLVYFDVKIRSQIGIGKFKIVATSGKERAEENVELDVRNPNPYVTNVLEQQLDPGASWNTAFSPVGMAGTNTGTLEVSTLPAMNLGKRLDYLIQYPHGCVEQTTSSVFPQLSLANVMDVSDRQAATLDANIKAGINRLKGFQLTDGGLGYWPGASTSDEWGTSYAGHFMLEAQEKGYALPPGFLDQWKKYQRNKAVSWSPSSYNFYGGDIVQAYRLYLLALAKIPELGAMNRLKEFQYLSVAAKWRLAAAYKLAGQAEAAAALIKGLSVNVQPYTQLSGTFGSDLRDKAMILETLTLMGQRAQANDMLRQVAQQLGKDSWYSTQTTAYALIAISKYCGVNKSGGKMTYTYRLNAANGNITSESYVSQVPVTFNGANGNVTLQNKGTNVLYARLILRGQPESGSNPYADNNPEVLNMKVVYASRTGQLVNTDNLKQGTDFVATVTMSNPGKRGYYENMALTQVFPSGWEIINTRLMGTDSSMRSSPFTYRDVRDDRVYTYFNLEESKTVTYQVLLNAAYLGRYYLPAASVEAMYDNTIHAFAPGKWVEVTK
ncbi:alpha-2-macroglobulin [Chitinophaga sp. SYP-B3965]|uniref:alpha-2-macroglobulin family protein n=1 Tax=Chitinophaga sp. SYP-B3965 TaxID=2663120 RepID=UPI0020A67A89|nr:MG2 domain-containing protein [Chitinophaga sp. SYP-B3965]